MPDKTNNKGRFKEKKGIFVGREKEEQISSTLEMLMCDAQDMITFTQRYSEDGFMVLQLRAEIQVGDQDH